MCVSRTEKEITVDVFTQTHAITGAFTDSPSGRHQCYDPPLQLDRVRLKYGIKNCHSVISGMKSYTLIQVSTIAGAILYPKTKKLKEIKKRESTNGMVLKQIDCGISAKFGN